MGDGIHIVHKAEMVMTLWGFPITNTILTSWIVMVVIGVTAYIVGKRLKKIPSKTQAFFEVSFSFFLNYIEAVLDSRELAKRFFPLIATLFIFILIGNWFGFVPGVGSVFVGEPIVVGAESYEASVPAHAMEMGEEHAEVQGQIAVFQPISVDFNFMLALAIIVFVSIQISGILHFGALQYVRKFFHIRSAMNFFMSIIELFSEMARLISFSFRFFVNMFAWKTLILVAMFFIPFFLPVPFMFFVVFVGVIQASIFALMTLFFIKFTYMQQ
jgi:F-type H+-transporting ATPase subunit a